VWDFYKSGSSENNAILNVDYLYEYEYRKDIKKMSLMTRLKALVGVLA